MKRADLIQILNQNSCGLVMEPWEDEDGEEDFSDTIKILVDGAFTGWIRMGHRIYIEHPFHLAKFVEEKDYREALKPCQLSLDTYEEMFEFDIKCYNDYVRYEGY